MDREFFEKLEQEETKKYDEVWLIDAYREANHSLRCLNSWPSRFRNVKSVIDFGCGNGAFALEMHNRGVDVLAIDISKNAPSQECKDALGENFIVQPLWHAIPHSGPAQLGVCCDVMEHMDERTVPIVLETIASACDRLFLKIAKFNEGWGLRVVKQRLHLTVKPDEWWIDQVEAIPNKRVVEVIESHPKWIFLEVR